MIKYIKWVQYRLDTQKTTDQRVDFSSIRLDRSELFESIKPVNL